MFRIFTTTAILALSISAAEAGSTTTVQFGDLNTANPKDAQVLAERIQQAAVTVCAPEASDESPRSLFYTAFYHASQDSCVHRVTQSALADIETAAEMKTKSSTAALYRH